MGKTTQKERLLSIATPLGEDYLLLNKIHAEERISELYNFEIELVYDEEEDNSYVITEIDPATIIGQTVIVEIAQGPEGEIKRTMTGMINNFTLIGRNRQFSFYNATIVPQVWRLTRSFQSRIFQRKTVPDILQEVFKGYQIKNQLQKSYNERNYCVQYQESDFDFASRLMEEEGIFYYFEHNPSMEKMVLRDELIVPEDCPNKSDIPIVNEDLTGEIFESAIKRWETDYRLQSGKVTMWDYNFQLPKKKLEVEKQSLIDVGKNKSIEVYKFPAGYARKYDEEIGKVFDDSKRTGDNRIIALDAQYKTVSGMSDCCTLTPGYRFELKNHPNRVFNGKYVLTSVRHDAEQSPDYVVGDLNPNAYINEFICKPSQAADFRPKLKTPKPVINGSQTAFVVGPSGEEIYTDKFGRVKVQFHWDRHGNNNEDSSCWIRVAQTWAGNTWGAMFIPRIGMEVLVHFIEGDPDQPIITGCVYNPDSMPPYTLPDEKTKSTIKSDSSKGGGGFNELRLEDKSGSEQIFVHGEKNIDVRIKNDSMETILRDRHLTIDRDQFELVKKDKHLQVRGDQNEKIDGTMSLKVGADLQEKVTGNSALDSGMSIHLKAGMNVVIEAGTSVTLKVGGNFVNVSQAGVTIKGTMVLINSGGAAVSGSGSSPEIPKDPLLADNAIPGTRIKPPGPMPPLTPTVYSPAALVMQQAARTGTPFCAICNS